LQAQVNSPDIFDEDKAKLQGWIQELKAGKNPFTDEVGKGGFCRNVIGFFFN